MLQPDPASLTWRNTDAIFQSMEAQFSLEICVVIR